MLLLCVVFVPKSEGRCNDDVAVVEVSVQFQVLLGDGQPQLVAVIA